MGGGKVKTEEEEEGSGRVGLGGVGRGESVKGAMGADSHTVLAASTNYR